MPLPIHSAVCDWITVADSTPFSEHAERDAFREVVRQCRAWGFPVARIFEHYAAMIP